jgi:hypothetical protein
MSTPERNKLLKLHHKACNLAIREWIENPSMRSANLPPLLKELRGMTCDARTRAGTPCKQKGIYKNGRCKLHGGMSTGPRTKKGKRCSSLNWKKRKIFMGDNEPHDMLRNVKVQR